MGKKYIIELPENTHWVQWILESTEDHHPYMDFRQVEALMPYAEPDLEQVREEAYLKGLNDGQGVILESTQNNAFNNGYKKCLEDMEQIKKEAFEKGYNTAVAEQECAVREASEKGYQKGLSDAWECARKIFCTSHGELERIFDLEEDDNGLLWVYHEYTASEAIEKIRQYEQEKEELGIQGYFKKGEGVIDADGTKAVILRVSEDNYCQVYTENGCIENWHIHTYKFHKDGRYFPEIIEVLQKMKEAE